MRWSASFAGFPVQPGASVIPVHKSLTPRHSIGRGSVKIQWLPSQTMTATPLHGLSVKAPHRERRGIVLIPKAFPPSPTSDPRLPSVVRPVSCRHPFRRGYAKVSQALPPSVPPPDVHLTPIHGLQVKGGQPRRRGWVWIPELVQPPNRIGFSIVLMPPAMVRRPGDDSQRRRPGKVSIPWFQSPPPAISVLPGTITVRRPGDNHWRSRPGHRVNLIPIGFPTPPGQLAYNIYSNAGSGPINYNSPIATVTGTTYTTAILAYPDDWKFGVRAFDAYGEEQNVDCMIDIILNSSGFDITNRPDPVIGLRAFAVKA